MKSKLLITAFSAMIISTANAQLPFTYTVDSTCFNAMQLEGGMTQMRFADVNNNGHLDLVSIGDHGSPFVNTNQHGVSVFFGNGTGGSWTFSQNGDFGYGGCAVGDINNDGKQDIAYGLHHDYSNNDFGDQLIEAAIGDGTGMNWTPWDDGLATNGESWGMFGTDLGDVDNDGWLDIASNSFGSGQGIHIYKNNQNGTWTQTYQHGSGNTGHYIQFGDIDGDGNLDFVASHLQGSPFFGNGNGTFTLKAAGLPPIGNFPYLDVSLGDIDNDGDDDFAFSFNPSSGTHGVFVYKWDRNAQIWVSASSGLPTSATDDYSVARLHDIDMDGFADLLTGSETAKEFLIYKGNGGTSWAKVYSFSLPGYLGIQDVAVADIDHSGYPDILIISSHLAGGPFNPSSRNKFKLLKDNVDPSSINATLLYPKGAECWRNNSVKFISWISSVPNNNSSSVKIEYSTAGNAGPWTLIAAAAPNNGTYQWTVPAAINSSNCFIRITAIDNVSSSTDMAMNTVPFNIGCTTSVTGMNEDQENMSLAVFPNPSNGVFNILTKDVADLKNAEVKVIDMLGQTVPVSYSVTNKLLLDMQNNVNGIYFVEIRNNDSVKTVKLVLEK